MNFLLLALGIGLLTMGGEALIRGSLAAAQRLGVSPLLSGLIIVGFGTSAPELVVSVQAALSAQPDIATGNVVGSNIGNILLILGVCALIIPLTVKPLMLRRDANAVVAATLLFLLLAADGELGPADGIIFLLTLLAFLVWAYRSERLHIDPAAQLHEAEAHELNVLPRSALWITILVVSGLCLLIAGSQVLLMGAIGLAQRFGVSESVIGLTLVAVGTSLPEFSISVIAALRGHAEVAVGNVLGSNIFNILGILGVSSLLQPLPLNERIVQFDQWVLLGASLLLLLFLRTGYRLNRLEGGILLAGYAAYIGLSFTTFSG